jgi:hypothetical protein
LAAFAAHFAAAESTIRRAAVVRHDAAVARRTNRDALIKRLR